MHMLGLDEKTEMQLPHVMLLHLFRDERYGNWLKFIAMYVIRFYLNTT